MRGECLAVDDANIVDANQVIHAVQQSYPQWDLSGVGPWFQSNLSSGFGAVATNVQNGAWLLVVFFVAAFLVQWGLSSSVGVDSRLSWALGFLVALLLVGVMVGGRP